jgi:hypothetical protein
MFQAGRDGSVAGEVDEGCGVRVCHSSTIPQVTRMLFNLERTYQYNNFLDL